MLGPVIDSGNERRLLLGCCRNPVGDFKQRSDII